MQKPNNYINSAVIFAEQLPKLNRVLKRAITGILFRYKISYLEWLIILKTVNPQGLSDIANDLGMIESVVSKYVVQLEKKGILVSDFDFTDNKFKLICHNPDFKELFQTLNKEIVTYFDSVLGILTYSEIEKLGELLFKLNGEYISYVNQILGIHQMSVPE